MGIAVGSLVGIFLAIYLTLYKMGVIGELKCSVGSCETVNLSKWSILLGAPVAAWGVAFYVTVFIVALLSLQPRYSESRGITTTLVALTGWGVVFSGWLTYLELFEIRAICMFCVMSAILVTILFALSLWDLASRPSVNRDSHSAVSPPSPHTVP
jgi:uncharacterized membrane protein